MLDADDQDIVLDWAEDKWPDMSKRDVRRHAPARRPAGPDWDSYFPITRFQKPIPRESATHPLSGVVPPLSETPNNPKKFSARNHA